MHLELHRIRSRELIREADAYRLARQAARPGPDPGATAPTGPSRPAPRRPPARLRR